MLLSLSFILLFGLGFAYIFQKLHLPALVGFLCSGILLGPHGLNVLDSSIYLIASDLRTIALIIILLRAGLSLSIRDLRQAGHTVLLLTFVPAIFEAIAITLLAMLLLQWSWLDAALLATIIAAVSPAVIVPRMLRMMEQRRGVQKAIPQMIMAGASADDVLVIVLFTFFLGMSQGSEVGLGITLLNLPLSLLFGILIGIGVGWILVRIFRRYQRTTVRGLLVLGASFLLVGLEPVISTIIPYSALLGVVSLGMILRKRTPVVASRLMKKYEKIWVFAEILLFILVGAVVDVSMIPTLGWQAFAVLGGGLLIRSAGVLVTMIGTSLSAKERRFVVVSYIPKATVQASIGALPLALGLSNGAGMLAIAVLAIMVTASLGAWVLDRMIPHIPVDEPLVPSHESSSS